MGVSPGRAGDPGGRTFVFVGPTLPATEVLGLLPEAVVRPPLAAGDLWSLPVRSGDVVAVVDGLFRQQRSIRHKELLALVDRGVAVTGAASMGALRAAELHDFGMRGVGQVFAWYLDGSIEGDDEVALVHGPATAGYPVFTTALVDVRARLRAASAAGSLDPQCAQSMVDALVRMPFTERDAAGMHRRLTSRLGPVAAAEFERAMAGFRVDVKADDARDLLRAISTGRLPGPSGPHPNDHVARSEVTRTTVYLTWQSAEVAADPGATALTRGLALACARILSRDYPQLHEEVALTSALADAAEEAPQLPGGGGASAGEEDALRRLLHVRGFLDRADGPLDDLVDPWLTDAERGRLGDRARLRAFVRRTHTAPWRAAQAVAELERRGRLEHWCIVAARVRALDERLRRQRPGFRDDAIPVDGMRRWAVTRWLGPDAQPTEHEWALALADRGYASERHWLTDARAVHPFAALRSHGHAGLDRA